MSKRFISLLILFIFVQNISFAGNVQPYVYTGVAYESNLFLRSDSQEAQELPGVGVVSDTRLDLIPGVRGEIDYHRQRFLFDIFILRRIYDRFETLDFTGGEAAAKWNWLYGNKWNGRFAYLFSDKPSEFTERLTIFGDSSKIHKISFNANRKISPRHTLLSGIAYKTNKYKRRILLSKDETQLELGIRHTSRAGNMLDLKYFYTDSKFPNRSQREINRGLDDGYIDSSLLARLRWQITQKTFFDIESGFTDREQDNIAESDFDGLIGTAIWEWAISEKTKLTSSVWRDLRDSEDRLSNYAKVDGVGLGIEWNNTAKITTFANLGYENWDFQSTSLNKEDEYSFARVGVNYSLKEHISITTDYAYEERESNIPTRDYDNKIFNLALEVGF